MSYKWKKCILSHLQIPAGPDPGVNGALGEAPGGQPQISWNEKKLITGQLQL